MIRIKHLKAYTLYIADGCTVCASDKECVGVTLKTNDPHTRAARCPLIANMKERGALQEQTTQAKKKN